MHAAVTLLPLEIFPMDSVTLMGGMNIFVWTSGLHFRSTDSTTLLLIFRLIPVDMTSALVCKRVRAYEVQVPEATPENAIVA